MTSSWKTTLAGVLGLLGAGALAASHVSGAPQWLAILGTGLIGAAMAGGFGVARDNDKTSEQVGAGKAGTK